MRSTTLRSSGKAALLLQEDNKKLVRLVGSRQKSARAAPLVAVNTPSGSADVEMNIQVSRRRELRRSCAVVISSVQIRKPGVAQTRAVLRRASGLGKRGRF